jgi:hypothetical protein
LKIVRSQKKFFLAPKATTLWPTLQHIFSRNVYIFSDVGGVLSIVCEYIGHENLAPASKVDVTSSYSSNFLPPKVHDNAWGLTNGGAPGMFVCLFVFTRPGGTHDRCFQPVTRFLSSLGQNPPVP